MHHATVAPQRSDALTLIAGTWLASGCVLLGLTPLPWHDATLGWTPAFWLLAAPCLLLLAKTLCARWAPSPEASCDRRERRRIVGHRLDRQDGRSERARRPAGQATRMARAAQRAG